MTAIFPHISAGIGAVLCLLILLASLLSWREGEPRAAARMLLALLPGILFFLPLLLSGAGGQILAVVLVSLSTVTLLLVLLPGRASSLPPEGVATRRIDERDTMFARRKLEPGSARAEEYYGTHPRERETDTHLRALPGLLSSRSAMHDPMAFAAADATFDTVDMLHAACEGDPEGDPADIAAQELTDFLRAWLLQGGAHSVGVTALRDEHLYSVKGRGEHYGEQVQRKHRWAIAVTVEMDADMVRCAPAAPIVMESSREYLASGALATQLAVMLRRLGYPAQAHIDGRYDVLCPLVARDAGLGEIGRMGLLMTPRLGPRVRIAVVTTDAPLLPDDRNYDGSMIDFCHRCSKCVLTCPGDAIPDGDRSEEDGTLRWKIDSEACFAVWCRLGTDCGRCMAVCPYSHPDTTLHRIVRAGLRHSPMIRSLAAPLDDLIYGSSPPPAEPSTWMRSH